MKSIVGLLCMAMLAGCSAESGADPADVSNSNREETKPEILTVGPWLASEKVAASLEAASRSGDLGALEWGPKFGGNNGALDQSFCPAVVGVAVNAGKYLDGMQLLCAAGAGPFDNRWPATHFGGYGGAPSNLTCPNGFAVTGIQGAAGSYVDRLGIRCTSGAGELWTSAVAGGGGGGPYSFDCPWGQVIIGFNIWHGELVDAIQPYCGARP